MAGQRGLRAQARYSRLDLAALRSARMHRVRRLGRDEAEHVLQDRVHDGVQPVLGEGLVVVLGPQRYEQFLVDTWQRLLLAE
jgi:hypothetical protein